MIQKTESTREITSDKVPAADMKQTQINSHQLMHKCVFVFARVCMCVLHEDLGPLRSPEAVDSV